MAFEFLPLQPQFFLNFMDRLLEELKRFLRIPSVSTLPEHAMDVGRISRQPMIPLAHLLLGMLDEAALYVSRAEVPAQARAEMDEVLDRMLLAL